MSDRPSITNGLLMPTLTKEEWLKQPCTQDLIAMLQRQIEQDLRIAVQKAVEGNNEAVLNLTIIAGIKQTLKEYIEKH